MHPVISMDAISPKTSTERVALVRNVAIGAILAFLLAGLPIWIIYAVLQFAR